MKKRILVVVCWMVIGTINYGAMNAQDRWDRHHEWKGTNLTWRDHMGVSIIVAYLFPPATFLIVLAATNFYQHGWSLSTAD